MQTEQNKNYTYWICAIRKASFPFPLQNVFVFFPTVCPNEYDPDREFRREQPLINWSVVLTNQPITRETIRTSQSYDRHS